MKMAVFDRAVDTKSWQLSVRLCWLVGRGGVEEEKATPSTGESRTNGGERKNHHRGWGNAGFLRFRQKSFKRMSERFHLIS